MSCSADKIKKKLQVHRNTYALVVSMENITLNWYWGNNRSMLMSNCLFRMGGAAVLLTNRGRRRAKYQLVHTVRTHHGADDRAYRCVFQEEDATGRVGVALSKDLMAVAGEALRTNITTLGPLVLPMSEQILFLASLVGRKVFGLRSLRPYIPDFKMAFEHFCIHAGGRAVLDTIEENLALSPWHMEPSRMTLYRWGNTSSSSLWYELAYTEAQGGSGIAFGSGFKCNSAVWRALRTIDPAKERDGGNPWVDEIHRFPVEVPRVERVVESSPAPETKAASSSLLTCSDIDRVVRGQATPRSHLHEHETKSRLTLGYLRAAGGGRRSGELLPCQASPSSALESFSLRRRCPFVSPASLEPPPGDTTAGAILFLFLEEPGLVRLGCVDSIAVDQSDPNLSSCPLRKIDLR
ncbi:hypothetical protein HU200_048687 [Digitaria exilis]|uniref:Very-long-chain 3-oxoacyl-CoA synthase n=1 Tax=Digitaria exilis TaxID=1010633 RepID=A0A835AWU1_9POAL|nr:hypothetical protein HU200_048687 [Digitaria exilis]